MKFKEEVSKHKTTDYGSQIEHDRFEQGREASKKAVLAFCEENGFCVDHGGIGYDEKVISLEVLKDFLKD